MNTHSRVVLLLSLVTLAFVTVLVVMSVSVNQQASVLLHSRMKERSLAFDTLVKLKGNALEMLAYDYTYWDDMVKFVASGDRSWAHDNLDTGIDSFKLNAAWVYNDRFDRIYSYSTGDDELLSRFTLTKEQMRDLFSHGYFQRFFVQGTNGLIEIRSAPVQPTKDVKRASRPQGFLLVGRLWTPEYVSELSRLSASTVEIVPFAGQKGQEGINTRTGDIVFSRPLHGRDLKPLAYLVVRERSAVLREMAETSRRNVLMLLVFAVSVLLLVWVLVWRWVSSPLRIISASLDGSDPSVLAPLHGDRGEFGRLAELIASFFSQKNDLVKEIGDRKKAEQELRQSEEKYRLLFNSIGDGITVFGLSAEGRPESCLELNDVALASLGYTREEAMRMNPMDFFMPEDAEKFAAVDREIRQSGRAQFEHVIPGKYGRRVPVEIRAQLFEFRGRPVLMTIVRDISQRKRAEEENRHLQSQLVQSSKMAAVGRLAGGVAHELNNPLTVILGLTQMQLQSVEPASPQRGDLCIIEESVLRCKNIIDSLLVFSKKGSEEFSPLSVNEAVENCIVLLDHELEIDRTKIEKELGEGLPPVLGNAQLLQQVFINLMINAHDAMPKGGTLAIATRRFGDCVQVVFRDTGHGIPASILKEIFDPFFTTRPVGRGTGLGLSVSASIIGRHNGKIIVSSEEKQGSVFTVILPCIIH